MAPLRGRWDRGHQINQPVALADSFQDTAYFCGFPEWLATELPPWAAYCSLICGCLIILDTHPRVWPMGVGKLGGE